MITLMNLSDAQQTLLREVDALHHEVQVTVLEDGSALFATRMDDGKLFGARVVHRDGQQADRYVCLSVAGPEFDVSGFRAGSQLEWTFKADTYEGRVAEAIDWATGDTSVRAAA